MWRWSARAYPNQLGDRLSARTSPVATSRAPVVMSVVETPSKGLGPVVVSGEGWGSYRSARSGLAVVQHVDTRASAMQICRAGHAGQAGQCPAMFGLA